MTSGFFSGAITRGLAVRILLFLSLALLPIGLIALVQTRQIEDESRAGAELSLIAATEKATLVERRILQEAFGAAEALGSIVRLRHDKPAECSEILLDYQQASNLYSTVGFVAKDGIMRCSSTGPADFRNSAWFKESLNTPTRRATTLNSISPFAHSEAVVYAPVYAEQGLLGFIVLLIPAVNFELTLQPDLTTAPDVVMTVNRQGDLLTADGTPEAVQSVMPQTPLTDWLHGKERRVFYETSIAGEDRVYAVLPIVTDTIYAVSVWPEDTPVLDTAITARATALLPILMWICSLIVAFWAVNRLAVTHIQKLGRQMRQFALNRNLPRQTLGAGVPTEFMEMESAFIGMAESILRDEATLEDGLRQKNILLKEVHHRVKNNLQLVSSIMNMQIREAQTEDAREVLQRLQDRILSLATIHKNLYQNDDLVQVNAAALLGEIVNQLLSVGLPSGSDVAVSQHYDDLMLDPDDAAPLSLLVSEAMTNALKYVGPSEQADPFIQITLTFHSPDRAELLVRNSVGDQTPREDATGLGSKLIQAFARQLNGQLDIETARNVYETRLAFPIAKQSRQIYDY